MPYIKGVPAGDGWSPATPLSILIAAVASGDMMAAEAQLADGVEWHQMPYNQSVKGKKDVMSYGSKPDLDPRRSP
jgi:hypothetical protein